MWRHIDVQADWRRSWTYGRAPNAIDISQGSLTCPSKHRHGTTLFIRWFRHTAPFSRLLRSRWGHGGHTLDLTPRALTGGGGLFEGHFRKILPRTYYFLHSYLMETDRRFTCENTSKLDFINTKNIVFKVALFTTKNIDAEYKIK